MCVLKSVCSAIISNSPMGYVLAWKFSFAKERSSRADWLNAHAFGCCACVLDWLRHSPSSIRSEVFRVELWNATSHHTINLWTFIDYISYYLLALSTYHISRSQCSSRSQYSLASTSDNLFAMPTLQQCLSEKAAMQILSWPSFE